MAGLDRRAGDAPSFTNDKFVPVHLVDNTAGYDSECAVFFPETVSVIGEAANTFGGIFCDREAARYQRVVGEAVQITGLELPPAVSALLASEPMTRDMFELWDLIHDRAHSHGELPFDPFMIRQRLPFWMYSLEELRCDLTAFHQAGELANDFPFAEYVQYGVLFDRLFRFPLTGGRVRNYDGLAGQLLFGFLHGNGILTWRNNTLTIDWARLPEGVDEPAAGDRGALPHGHQQLEGALLDRRSRPREQVRSAEPRLAMDAGGAGRTRRGRPQGMGQPGQSRRVPAEHVLPVAGRQAAADDRVDR